MVAPCAPASASPTVGGRLFFTSAGKTWWVAAAGGEPRAFDFDVPGQASWQPCGFLADGRVLMLSMEPRRDGPGRPFDEYYTLTPTHIWAHDTATGALAELTVRDRLAVFYTPQLVLPGERLLVQVCRPGSGQVYNMALDGSDARPFTAAGEGLPYGFSLSPDGSRVAFHLASPSGYQIWTSDTFGGRRVCVAGHPDHLYFAPAWSPDGQWLAYEDCHYRTDPGHDWSDIRLSRPDGSEHRGLTEGQAMWFGATYGSPAARGGGSNCVAWSADGALLFPRRLPGACVPWEFQPQRPDTDHFNRDWHPERAVGGTHICRLDPATGQVVALTSAVEGTWDFRSTAAPDGAQVAFCRAVTGGVPSLWVMAADGSQARVLTAGAGAGGADHPRWWP
jgi:TolB protein